jgi:nifR3 family TIM-barrel protein
MGTDVLSRMIASLGRTWLAPMTGISDLPFRLTAARLGARYVATEMIACEALLASRSEALRRAAVGEGLPIMVVQLVGADPATVAGAARLACAAGAQIVDLNFGCPAKSVTGVACGSALMRDPERLEAIVGAACEASSAPVTVKMRLGWDETSRNAPELALRAQAAGAQAVTVHGRTRAQFYAGSADWRAVRQVRDVVAVPVIVNGDIVDLATARSALAASGAQAVMIGRGALGRPWIAGVIESGLEGAPIAEPSLEERLAIVLEHLALSVRFHGDRLGVLTFRKHLAAYVEAAPRPAHAEARRALRARLCRMETAGEVEAALCFAWGDDLGSADARLAA